MFLSAVPGGFLSNCSWLLIPNYITKIVVSNKIDYIYGNII